MIVVHVFDNRYWDVWFKGTPYSEYPKKLLRVKDWISTAKADICYNLSYFNMSNGAPVTYVKSQGCDCGYGGVQDRLTVSQGNVVGGYAVGIKDGEVVMRGDGTARTRNGIGLTSTGRVIIAQSTSKVTERNFCRTVGEQVAMYYKDAVKLFLMEDGGASTQMYSNISKLGITPEGGRKVSTVTCVKAKVIPKVSRTLNTGCTGEDVRLLQMVLGGIVCDGVYGNATKKRVKEAQKALGLKVDGSCGTSTQKALGLCQRT